jgi:uncharacterized protein (TIGR00251 family)
MIQLKSQAGSVTFAVRVQPRASRTTIRGELDGALRVALAAPPVDGAANEELVRFLARLLRVPIRQVSLLAGQTSKNKVVAIAGVTAEEVAEALGQAS